MRIISAYLIKQKGSIVDDPQHPKYKIATKKWLKQIIKNNPHSFFNEYEFSLGVDSDAYVTEFGYGYSEGSDWAACWKIYLDSIDPISPAPDYHVVASLGQQYWSPGNNGQFYPNVMVYNLRHAGNNVQVSWSGKSVLNNNTPATLSGYSAALAMGTGNYFDQNPSGYWIRGYAFPVPLKITMPVFNDATTAAAYEQAVDNYYHNPTDENYEIVVQYIDSSDCTNPVE